MKVVCQSRNRSDVEIERCKRWAQFVAEELEIGEIYTVYSQLLVDGCLEYLIVPGEHPGPSRPFWYPASFFRVVDGSIPRSWIFSFAREDDMDNRTMWGYPEIVTSYDHYEGLIERRADAMGVFLRRKAEIDLEQNAEMGTDKTK